MHVESRQEEEVVHGPLHLLYNPRVRPLKLSEISESAMLTNLKLDSGTYQRGRIRVEGCRVNAHLVLLQRGWVDRSKPHVVDLETTHTKTRMRRSPRYVWEPRCRALHTMDQPLFLPL